MDIGPGDIVEFIGDSARLPIGTLGTVERTFPAPKPGARDLFSRRGFAGVGIRDVARAVGMSTGAVFSSFSDKRDLWRAAMGRDPAIERALWGVEP